MAHFTTLHHGIPTYMAMLSFGTLGMEANFNSSGPAVGVMALVATAGIEEVVGLTPVGTVSAHVPLEEGTDVNSDCEAVTDAAADETEEDMASVDDDEGLSDPEDRGKFSCRTLAGGEVDNPENLPANSKQTNLRYRTLNTTHLK